MSKNIVWERIESLINRENISAYKLGKDTGISTASLTDWKKGRSRILDTFIKSVTIYSDRVEIVFNYKNELPAFNTQCATGSHFKVLVGNMYNKANHFYINSTAYPITLIVPFNS